MFHCGISRLSRRHFVLSRLNVDVSYIVICFAFFVKAVQSHISNIILSRIGLQHYFETAYRPIDQNFTARHRSQAGSAAQHPSPAPALLSTDQTV